MSGSESIIRRDETFGAHNYHPLPVVIAKAEGESSRFVQTLAEYEKAPAITRKRLYLETMEYVLANNNKVLMTVKDGSNLMYIPLDKLMQGRNAGDLDRRRDDDAPAGRSAKDPRRLHVHRRGPRGDSLRGRRDHRLRCP